MLGKGLAAACRWRRLAARAPSWNTWPRWAACTRRAPCRATGGHGLRADHAARDQEARLLRRLSASTRSLVDGLAQAAKDEGVPFSADCEGGMFGFFLLPELPQNYPAVLKTDSARFNQLFHGLLDRGVYIAPALYEAGFVSGAHTADDIAATVAAAREVFKTLSK